MVLLLGAITNKPRIERIINSNAHRKEHFPKSVKVIFEADFFILQIFQALNQKHKNNFDACCEEKGITNLICLRKPYRRYLL